ncbi:unnamed protein product [Boreogadus saida]
MNTDRASGTISVEFIPFVREMFDLNGGGHMVLMFAHLKREMAVCVSVAYVKRSGPSEREEASARQRRASHSALTHSAAFPALSRPYTAGSGLVGEEQRQPTAFVDGFALDDSPLGDHNAPVTLRTADLVSRVSPAESHLHRLSTQSLTCREPHPQTLYSESHLQRAISTDSLPRVSPAESHIHRLSTQSLQPETHLPTQLLPFNANEPLNSAPSVR